MELRGSYTDFLNERNAQNNTIKESLLRDNPKMIMRDIEPHLKSAEDCKLEKVTILWNRFQTVTFEQENAVDDTDDDPNQNTNKKKRKKNKREPSQWAAMAKEPYDMKLPDGQTFVVVASPADMKSAFAAAHKNVLLKSGTLREKEQVAKETTGMLVTLADTVAKRNKEARSLKRLLEQDLPQEENFRTPLRQVHLRKTCI